MIRPTLVVLGILALAAPLLAEKGANTKQVLSPTYTIDKIYRSMEGPASSQKVYLGDPDKPELIWITGLKTEMVGEDGKTAQLPELMCHVNVDLDAARHQAMLGLKRPVAARLVTLSQGMLSAKVPAGFGFPIASNEPLVLFTQVLNHNIVHPENIKVRHRVTIEYVRDRDLAQPLKPLFNVGASGSVLLDSANALNTSMPGMPGAGAAPSPSSSMPAMPGMGAGANPLAVDAGGQHGASCLLLPRAPNAGAGGGSDYTDPQGRKLTGHWIVPPGRQVNHSDITWFMALPYDTVLHYAAVHLHPFAESLTLRDMTTDETLFTAKALGPRKGVGLTHVDTFSSQKGLPLYRNHKYELISVYNNSTRETHDSMASVFLGLEDPEFEHPTRELLEERAADMVVPTNDTGVIVRTSSGDFGIQLYPDRAPAAVRAFVRLVRAHAYDHARFSRVVPYDAVEVMGNGQLNATQYSAIATRLETTLKHETGSISLCPGEASFAIVIGPGGGRDGRCAVVGRVGPGSGLIGQIANAPRDAAGAPSADIEITRLEVIDLATEGSALKLAPVQPLHAAVR